MYEGDRLNLSPCTYLESSSYYFICCFTLVKDIISHIWLTTQADGIRGNSVARVEFEPKMAREKVTENFIMGTLYPSSKVINMISLRRMIWAGHRGHTG
jgi:hypothetical protein